MNVSLTPELEKIVQSKVETGMYNSASEVVREALRMMTEQDRLREMKFEELRTEIQKGLSSGASIPLNIEGIKTRGRKRLAEQKQ